MNDYLWNKTGDDPEIRRLEETLAVFKHEPDAAPLLASQQRVAAEVVSRPSWTLWLRLAFAGSAAAVVAASVWIWAMQEREISQSTRVDAERSVIAQPESGSDHPAKAKDAATSTIPGTAHTSRVKASAHSVSARPASVRRMHHAGSRKTTVRSNPPELTREEKYAYERLMLALSITGSKLKIVRDTINGESAEDDKDRSDKR